MILSEKVATQMDMGRNKKQIGLALDADLLANLDDWLAAQRFPPSRTAVIEDLIREFLGHQSLGGDGDRTKESG